MPKKHRSQPDTAQMRNDLTALVFATKKKQTDEAWKRVRRIVGEIEKLEQ